MPTDPVTGGNTSPVPDNLAMDNVLPQIDFSKLMGQIKLPTIGTPRLPGIKPPPINQGLQNRAYGLSEQPFISQQQHAQMVGGQLGNIAAGREAAMQAMGNRMASRGMSGQSPLMGQFEAQIAAQNIGQQAQAKREMDYQTLQQNRQAMERGLGIGQQSQEQALGAWSQGLNAQNQLANTGADIYRTQVGSLPTYLQAQMQPAQLAAQLHQANLQAWPEFVRAYYEPSRLAAQMYTTYLPQLAGGGENNNAANLWQLLLSQMGGLG